MPKPYSIDLRQKIVTAYENEEGSMQTLADRFKVSKNFVADLLKRFKQTNQIAPKNHGGGHPPSIKAEGEIFLIDLIKSQPDLILEEIRDEYNEHFEYVSRSTIDRTLTRLKLTRKKRPCLILEKIHPKIDKNNKITK